MIFASILADKKCMECCILQCFCKLKSCHWAFYRALLASAFLEETHAKRFLLRPSLERRRADCVMKSEPARGDAHKMRAHLSGDTRFQLHQHEEEVYFLKLVGRSRRGSASLRFTIGPSRQHRRVFAKSRG